RVTGHHTVPSRGMRRGQVVDPDAAAGAVSSALRGLAAKTGFEPESAVVGVSGGHLEGHNARGFVPIIPPGRQIQREDVLQAVNHSRQILVPPDREQIQALPREFRVDGQRGILRPIGVRGTQLEVLTFLATGKTEQLQSLERAVNAAGLRVEQMVLKSLGSGLGVLGEEARKRGAAVVDLGAGNTDLAVFSGGAFVYGASIPLGSELVTSDIAALVQTSPEEAERLKVQHGCAWAAAVNEGDVVDVLQLGHTQARPMRRRVLCEIIECRAREIAGFVQKHVDRSGAGSQLGAGLVLTGRGALLEGAVELFQNVFEGLPVSVAAPSAVGLGGARADRMGLAAACGLAAFAIESREHELVPASGGMGWRDRIRTFWSLLGGRS
ncbi:MAG: cell division protein FtsA, partial [Fimbriimonadales bacterium]|nr:cell division protein FtsA [Fimbriimonadales bacterium]